PAGIVSADYFRHFTEESRKGCLRALTGGRLHRLLDALPQQPSIDRVARQKSCQHGELDHEPENRTCLGNSFPKITNVATAIQPYMPTCQVVRLSVSALTAARIPALTGKFFVG